jgi:acetylornithine/N-succinyldiaminopimelate aminotransferase
MASAQTIDVENAHMPPFFAKTPISIVRGEGVVVWDEEGERYLDLTAGWGVTSIGHAHPAIVAALAEQGGLILQNPDSGLTYSPARARLLTLLCGVLPAGLDRIFFTNSGAEANDAAVKLARKVTGRRDVVACEGSFHGRTISMVSATGQARHRDKFVPTSQSSPAHSTRGWPRSSSSPSRARVAYTVRPTATCAAWPSSVTKTAPC